MNGNYNDMDLSFNNRPVYYNGRYYMFWLYYVSDYTWGISPTVGVLPFDDSAVSTLANSYPNNDGLQWLFIGPSETGGHVKDNCDNETNDHDSSSSG